MCDVTLLACVAEFFKFGFICWIMNEVIVEEEEEEELRTGLLMDVIM